MSPPSLAPASWARLGTHTSPAIEARGLRRTFGPTVAVEALDLTVERGEIYGFLGPNGAGKTTSVRMLCTLLRPTSGHARVAGFDVVHDTTQVRLRVGVALQEAALDAGQSGRELLELQARLFALPGSLARRRIAELIELVDLGDAIDRRVATYSGGMRRRLDLALALVHEPEVIFLDEPTTGLDPVSRRQVWTEVRRLNEHDGVTIFLTTQYLEEADALAGRVGIISGGRLVVEGTPDELKRSVGRDVVVVTIDGGMAAAHEALRALDIVEHCEAVGDELVAAVASGPAAVPRIASALDGLPLTVREISVRRPSLDDVFLEVTGARLGASAGTVR